MKIVILGAGPAGLYSGLLIKKAHPTYDITIIERNPADVTYGWGVVFSDRTLGAFQRADYKTYEQITQQFVIWDAIDVRYRGEIIRCGGHVIASISRQLLLNILQRRCLELGIAITFQREIQALADLGEYDLLIAADGLNSLARKSYASHFKPEIELGSARYIWLGAQKVLDAFTFIFRENERGFFQVHAYPFSGTSSTFIVECDEASWRRAGLDSADEQSSLAWCERLLADDLQGTRLLSNNSRWINFPTLKTKSWHHQHIVLLGDAAHTAHFSIGSGTKLAMEDAIALAGALEQHTELEAALNAYEMERKPVVETFQRAAQTSQHYFETVRRYRGLEPIPFAFQLLTRSGRISYDDLRLRDARFGETVDRWWSLPLRRIALSETLPTRRVAPINVPLDKPSPSSMQQPAPGRPYPTGQPHPTGQPSTTTGQPHPTGRPQGIAPTIHEAADPFLANGNDAWQPSSAPAISADGADQPVYSRGDPLRSPWGGGHQGEISSPAIVAAPPPMFAPFSLRTTTLPNRVAVSTTGTAFEGIPGEAYIDQINERAASGAGLLITGFTAVASDGRITPETAGMYDEAQLEDWTQAIRWVHTHSQAKIALQLGHAGRRGAVRPGDSGLDRPLRQGGWPLLSASALPYTPQSQLPRAMDGSDMQRVRADFVSAARMAHETGFDLLHLNFAQGYLPASFLSPLTNHRQDDYGGDLARRMRFPLELFDAVRATWPQEQAIIVAITTDDCAKGGATINEAVMFAKTLRDHGCDMIEVRIGQTSLASEPTYGRGFLTSFSDQLRNTVGIPTLVGGYLTTNNEVNTVLAAARADLCIKSLVV